MAKTHAEPHVPGTCTATGDSWPSSGNVIIGWSARGENLLRSRRGVARDTRWGLEPAEGKLALRPSPSGAVGVHNVVESSVGAREGGELKRAVGLAAHRLNAAVRV